MLLKWTVLPLTLLFVLSPIKAISVEEDLRISQDEKKILDKFKEIVSPNLPHEYMKTDIYLIRWLRARDFNLKAAERMLEDNLQWRRENDLDNILNEKGWAEFSRQYKGWVDGHDKAGRPIVFLDVGEWDIRAGMLSGLGPKMIRAYDRVLERVNLDIRMAQSEGQNVTQYYLIIDLEGYNLVQHACPQCIGVYLNIIISYENHFHGTCHKIVLINTPAIFQPILSVCRNLASPLTRDIVFVYGRGKEGREELLMDINADQLPIEVGGTRELPYNF